jgi:hypothetical protein
MAGASGFWQAGSEKQSNYPYEFLRKLARCPFGEIVSRGRHDIPWSLSVNVSVTVNSNRTETHSLAATE